METPHNHTTPTSGGDSDTPADSTTTGTSLGALSRRLALDTSRYLPASVIPALLSVVGVSVFTRIFGSGPYGQYALVVATAMFVSVFLSGWLRQSIMRYLPRVDGRVEFDAFVDRLSAALLALSLASLVLFLAAGWFIDRHWPDYRQFVLPTIGLVLTEMAFLTYGAVLQASLRSRAFATYKIVWTTLRLALALAFVLWVDRHPAGIITGAFVANALVVVPMAGQLGVWRRFASVLRSFDGRFVRILANYGLPMVGWMVGGQILALSDRFVLSAFRGSGEVGIYSANYGLVSMGFGLITGPVLTACYPLIMKAWEKGDRERVPALITQFSRYYVLAVIPIITLIGVYSRDIVAIVLGAEFREGYTIIPLVLGGLAVWWLAMIGHKGLEITERTRTMLVLVLICAAANIALNLVFVPRYGYTAAAATTAISYALYPLLVYFVARPTLPWGIPWATVARSLLAGGVMGVWLAFSRRLLPGNLYDIAVMALAGLVGLGIYFLILRVLREFHPEELAVLRRR